MSHRPLYSRPSAFSPDADPLLPSLTPCDRIALGRLNNVFEEGRSLAVLIGQGKARTDQVVQSFVAGVEEGIDFASISSPCPDAISFMRDVIRAMGFETHDLSLADLDNIFRMFLSFQKTHHRRTVVCVPEAQECGPWVFDKVRELVELDTKQRFGLMIILAGRRDLHDLLNKPPLEAVAPRVGRRISVAPLAFDETREFLRRRVEASRDIDIGQVFEFEAITRIHDISSGISDSVSSLCSKCLQLADQKSGAMVTVPVVDTAAKSLGLIQPPKVNGKAKPVEAEDDPKTHARLIVRRDGEIIQEQPLDRDCISIGRDRHCDVCIPCPTVSRNHALISISPDRVKLMDLGSTNGIFIDGEKIEFAMLTGNEEVTLGDCVIEYVAETDDQPSEEKESAQDEEPVAET